MKTADLMLERWKKQDAEPQRGEVAPGDRVMGRSGDRKSEELEPQRAQESAEGEEAPAGDPPPHHEKRMSGTPVAAPHGYGGPARVNPARDLCAQPGAAPPQQEKRALRTPMPVPRESAGAAGKDGVRASGIPQEETLDVVTADYKVVKVAQHVVHNMKEDLRKRMGLPAEWARDEEKIAYHRRQLALLEKADAAPRCEHIRADGTRCRGPRLRAGKKCYAHARMDEARPQRLGLPALEDANSVLLAVMEIQRALVDGLISEKTAGLLLYSVQIGAWAVGRATFAETEPEEMVRRLPESPELRGKDRKPRRTQRNTEGEEGLTRIDADERGPDGQLAKPVISGQHSAVSHAQTFSPQRTRRTQRQNKTLNHREHGGTRRENRYRQERRGSHRRG